MKEAIVYIILMGVQMFLIKLCSKHLPWQSLLLFVWCFAFVVIFTFVMFNREIVFSAWSWLAIGAGLLAGVGTIIMYKIIKTKDLGFFAPFLNMVPLVAVIMSFIFIGEPITFKKVCAIICGVAIIFLLQ